MSGGGAAYARAQTDDPANRHPQDFYPTWPAATGALLRVEKFRQHIWEPACGAGDMARVLRRAGHDVFDSDLHDHGHGFAGIDFLNCLPPPFIGGVGKGFDIVTNPPFRLAQEFVERALHMTAAHDGKVAMFLRLAMLEGVRRREWWQAMPLARVHVMSRRVPMQRGRLARPGEGHGTIAFAWFIFEHSHAGPAEIHWLDWKTGDAA